MAEDIRMRNTREAERGVRAALAGEATETPNTGDGRAEMTLAEM